MLSRAPGGLSGQAPFSAEPVQEDHLAVNEGAGAGAQPIAAVGLNTNDRGQFAGASGGRTAPRRSEESGSLWHWHSLS
jgi:hypothetical protein